MIKCDEVTNPASCLNSAAEDEPIFVLRANDENAPDIVREWAAAYLKSKGNAMTDRQREKHAEALTLAARMSKWKRQRGSR